MDLFATVSEDIKNAMKAKDKVALETLRNVKKVFLEAKTAPGANDELSDDYSTRFVNGINYPYVLKLEVADLDEDGNNIINFLFVNMETGEVEAQIKCESEGGRVGRYSGLLEQGFESAGENFVDELKDLID